MKWLSDNEFITDSNLHKAYNIIIHSKHYVGFHVFSENTL